ncbi:DUF4352 domain-containing protein [Pseudarthrobacter sp. RMG13]|uniref:DUF4352 domain-containing protein n=1 Tax=Pseudarthrobacter humi TaxID=2952523 RepID=A0ABT1LL30_9MICC|nr:DUF4352 domain-containing protein [Pseudarthrobacter humi]MCP8999150.1 DUF4352 domain-containing protein [Pseudarthrobacter humi]
MTTPEFPGAGSQQTSPNHPPVAQSAYEASTQTLPPRPTKAKKPLNVVGLIALITAVLGFIFACMPGALIVGWILLPIAFVLALVSLFQRDKPKGMGITALILSIVGTIVGVVVFFGAVGSSIDNALGSGDTKVVAPSGDAGATNGGAAEAPAAKTGTRETPHPIGSVIESKDWRVVVNSVTLAATDAVVAANQFNDPPAAGSEYILVNYSATYIGDDANGQTPSFVSVEYVTADGRTVNSYDKNVVEPDPISSNALYKGGSATGNQAFEVPSATAAQGVLAVRAGMFGDKVFVAVK